MADLDNELKSLLTETVALLRERISSGTAKPADVANAIKLLAAHGIEFKSPRHALTGLIESLDELPYTTKAN